MSTKSTSATATAGAEKNQQKRSCLAVVESDCLFDGRRRVRLPLPSSEGKSSSPDEEVELLGLKQNLANALDLPSTTNASGMEIEL